MDDGFCNFYHPLPLCQKKKKSTQKLSNHILINIKSNALKSFALFIPEKLFKETNKMGGKKAKPDLKDWMNMALRNNLLLSM